MTLPDTGTQLWLTRRIIISLLKLMTQAMASSCPGGNLTRSLAPSTRLALEFEAANEPVEGMTATVHRPETPVPNREVFLITSIVLNATAERVSMQFHASGYQRVLVMTRAEAHHLLGVLYRRSVAAGWDLIDLPEWLTVGAARQH